MKVDFSVFYSQSALSTIHIDCEHTVTADLEILSMKKTVLLSAASVGVGYMKYCDLYWNCSLLSST